MKRLIVLALVFTLALGIVLVPSASGGVCYPLEIIKIAHGPAEDFTFEAWRDINNNGILDFDDPVYGPDLWGGQVVITGNGTGVICVPWKGNYIIHEVLIAGSVYGQPPDQVRDPMHLPVTFENWPREEEKGRLIIEKVDAVTGERLGGAWFDITPDPRTCTGSLELRDNESPDECPEDGLLCLSGLQVCCAFNVTETKAPPGYTLITTPQEGHVKVPGETVTLTFPNAKPLAELVIVKEDRSGNALAGACFKITPDPRTGADSLELCDNDANDECPEDGVLCLSNLIDGLTCTVEETVAPPGYEPGPPQTVTLSGRVEVTFVNTKCELTIRKVDQGGNLLPGACFTITPDPRTGEGSLVLCDNDANDECPADGVLCLSEVMCGLDITVEETVVPDGYQGAPPQTGTIPATLTFVNTRKEASCGTICAAQTAPGEYLFDPEQENWFTWITYDKGWGTEASPKTYPIYTGKDKLCGTLYVYDKVVSAGTTHIFVNYVLTDMNGCTLGGLSEYHLQVDKSLTDLKKNVMNKKNPVPGKCEYKDTFDPTVPATGWIEAAKDNITSWPTAYIFAHGVGCYYCP